MIDVQYMYRGHLDNNIFDFVVRINVFVRFEGAHFQVSDFEGAHFQVSDFEGKLPLMKLCM